MTKIQYKQFGFKVTYYDPSDNLKLKELVLLCEDWAKKNEKQGVKISSIEYENGVLRKD